MYKLFFLNFIFLFLLNNGQCQEFMCATKNGRYSTNQCDAYIECNNGKADFKLCPDGLLFNPKAPFFGYPCGYPIEVDCRGRTALQPAQSTEFCPRQFGYFRMGDSRNCGQYVNCAHGDGYIFTCPHGLAFNEQTYTCDWPDSVDSCDAGAFLGFKCPVDGNGITDFATRLYPHPTDCEKFYVCVDSRPYLQSCDHKEVFNDLTGLCDRIENVKSCAPSKDGSTYFRITDLKQQA